MQCLIIAGGLATRLYPITRDIPKSLISIRGRPFIDYQLEHLRAQGVTEVVLALGHLAEQVVDHLQRVKPEGLKWTVSLEQGQLLGTGGAIRNAIDQGLMEERFLVTWGDSFLPAPIEPLWKAFVESKSLAMMTYFKNDGRWDQSNIALQAGDRILYDKRGRIPNIQKPFIDYGMMAFQRDFIRAALKNEGAIDLCDPLFELANAGKLSGFEVHERFYEVGSPGGIADFEAYLGQTKQFEKKESS